MNHKAVSYAALVCAILALALQLETRAQFDQRVAKVCDEREKNYCSQLALKLNESRDLMGFKPVSPTNFADVLSSYFQSMATVMDLGITNAPPSRELPDK
jgi:hypothetical protein